MPRLEISGFEELVEAFSRLEKVPDEVVIKVVQAMGDIAADAVKQQGEAMGVRAPNSDVHILDKIKVGKPRTTEYGAQADITFTGSRKRGNTATRNAEIAFLNEYGKQGQTARPFIKTAFQREEKKIVQAGADILGEWQEQEFSK